MAAGERRRTDSFDVMDRLPSLCPSPCHHYRLEPTPTACLPLIAPVLPTTICCPCHCRHGRTVSWRRVGHSDWRQASDMVSSWSVLRSAQRTARRCMSCQAGGIHLPPLQLPNFPVEHTYRAARTRCGARVGKGVADAFSAVVNVSRHQLVCLLLAITPTTRTTCLSLPARFLCLPLCKRAEKKKAFACARLHALLCLPIRRRTYHSLPYLPGVLPLRYSVGLPTLLNRRTLILLSGSTRRPDTS